MPTLSPLTWIAEQNTKLSADSHIISYRVQLAAANTGGTFPIPTAQTNPAQAQFPGIAPTGEPQQGRRFFCTKLVIRDANGSLGGTGAATVTLQDTTQGTPVAAASVASGVLGPNNATIFTVNTLTTVVNPNDQLAIIYAPGTGTATATAFTADVFGYFQQGI